MMAYTESAGEAGINEMELVGLKVVVKKVLFLYQSN